MLIWILYACIFTNFSVLLTVLFHISLGTVHFRFCASFEFQSEVLFFFFSPLLCVCNIASAPFVERLSFLTELVSTFATTQFGIWCRAISGSLYLPMGLPFSQCHTVLITLIDSKTTPWGTMVPNFYSLS